MNYLDFENRWLKSGGAERANYALFLQDLCDLLGVPRPDPTTDRPAQDGYVLERAVTFDDGGGRQSIGRIDLYKRGCFVLETKQGVDRMEEVASDEKTRRRAGIVNDGTTERRNDGTTERRNDLLRLIQPGKSWA